MKKSIRHVYYGGNTRYGFRGFYQDLLKFNEHDRVFILKGGPGTGKSTFIKKVGNELSSSGWDIDFLRCSGDPASMDGVISNDAGIIVVDGTSPHTLDPSCPGAREEIINLGDYWDESLLQRHKQDIMKIIKEKQDGYKRAYCYLAAAGAIMDDSRQIYKNAFENGKLQVFVEKLCNEIFYDMDYSVKWGTNRNFFATAITPSGIQGNVDTLFQGYRVYSIKTPFGCDSSCVLETVQRRARLCGFATESCYCGFDPNCLEHVAIPELGIAVVSSNDYHEAQGSDVYYEYPMEGFLCEYSLYNLKDDLKYNRIRFDELIDKAVRCLFKSRQLHSEMEEIYIASMDFEAMNTCIESALSRIEETVQRSMDLNASLF